MDWQDSPPIEDFEKNVPNKGDMAHYWVLSNGEVVAAQVVNFPGNHPGRDRIHAGEKYVVEFPGKEMEPVEESQDLLWWPVAIEPPKPPGEKSEHVLDAEGSAAAGQPKP